MLILNSPKMKALLTKIFLLCFSWLCVFPFPVTFYDQAFLFMGGWGRPFVSHCWMSSSEQQAEVFGRRTAQTIGIENILFSFFYISVRRVSTQYMENNYLFKQDLHQIYCSKNYRYNHWVQWW